MPVLAAPSPPQQQQQRGGVLQPCSPMKLPADALESAATITPGLNFNASVVVPWFRSMLTSRPPAFRTPAWPHRSRNPQGCPGPGKGGARGRGGVEYNKTKSKAVAYIETRGSGGEGTHAGPDTTSALIKPHTNTHTHTHTHTHTPDQGILMSRPEGVI